jgi:hypothetical protein
MNDEDRNQPAPGYQIARWHHQDDDCPLAPLVGDEGSRHTAEIFYQVTAEKLGCYETREAAIEATWEHHDRIVNAARDRHAPSDAQILCARTLLDNAFDLLNRANRQIGAKRILDKLLVYLDEEAEILDGRTLAAILRERFDELTEDASQ